MDSLIILLRILETRNRMITRAFSDMWSLEVFLKFPNCTSRRRVQFEDIKNIARAHISRNARAIIRFPTHIPEF